MSASSGRATPIEGAEDRAPSSPAPARLLIGRLVPAAVGFAIALAIWQATIRVYGLEPIVLPKPLSVAGTLLALGGDAAFWRDIAVSLKEFALGYLGGGALGIAVGLMVAERLWFRMTVGPVLEALRFIVPFAWIPLTVLWFGISLIGKVLLVGYAVFFVMVVSTARSIAQLDPTLTRVATMLGMGPLAMALRVHLRAAAPGIASGAKAAAAVGWIAVVAAEYVGASAGLGVRITNAAMSLATAEVIAGMVVIGIIGAGVSALVGWLSRTWLAY